MFTVKNVQTYEEFMEEFRGEGRRIVYFYNSKCSKRSKNLDMLIDSLPTLMEKEKDDMYDIAIVKVDKSKPGLDQLIYKPNTIALLDENNAVGIITENDVRVEYLVKNFCRYTEV